MSCKKFLEKCRDMSEKCLQRDIFRKNGMSVFRLLQLRTPIGSKCIAIGPRIELETDMYIESQAQNTDSFTIAHVE